MTNMAQPKGGLSNIPMISQSVLRRNESGRIRSAVAARELYTITVAQDRARGAVEGTFRMFRRRICDSTIGVIKALPVIHHVIAMIEVDDTHIPKMPGF